MHSYLRSKGICPLLFLRIPPGLRREVTIYLTTFRLLDSYVNWLIEVSPPAMVMMPPTRFGIEQSAN